ncbi:MAG: PLP-dependent aminotransferase family protein, partial [Flavobacteriaceae bacterium]
KGVYVHGELPQTNPRTLGKITPEMKRIEAHFPFHTTHALNWIQYKNSSSTHIDTIKINDGIGDSRITPMEGLAKIYRRISWDKNAISLLEYGDPHGNPILRNTLSEYLNETRGLGITPKNILITRGSQMGIYLSSKLLVRPGDPIVVGQTNYIAANLSFKAQGAQLVPVRVDQEGLNIDDIASICKKDRIKAVYITPHHHHPTTVTLSAERRLHLLNLAQQYRFAIIEDNYDYDFNYDHAPFLPLASHDVQGNVIYIGSVCKTVAPAYRVGYLVGPENFVREAATLRRYIDRQGDPLLEQAIAEFIANGDLDRHIRKVSKVYGKRRDFFCKLMQQELSEFFQFRVPSGGMAVWTILNPRFRWSELAKAAKPHRIEIGAWRRYDPFEIGHNGIRIGFASHNEPEISMLVERLKRTLLDVL